MDRHLPRRPEKGGESLQGGGPLIAKATLARELGAAGILYIKGFNPEISSELVPLDTPVRRSKILPALCLSNHLSEIMLTAASTDGKQGLESLYRSYAAREVVAGFDTGFALDARIDLDETSSHGRNVLARLQVGEHPSEQVVMIGAHADHVGFGNRGGSLAKGLTANRVHPVPMTTAPVSPHFSKWRNISASSTDSANSTPSATSSSPLGPAKRWD